MLRIYRRHLKACGHKSERYRRCSCPIHIEGTLGGEWIKRSLDLTSWQAASDLLAGWNASGKIGVVRQDVPEVPAAVERFFEDAKARGLRESTTSKLRVVLEKQLIPFCEGRGIRLLRQISPDDVRRFRETWKDCPISSLKKLERLRGFFRFCVLNGWIQVNPAASLKPPKVQPSPTLPFTQEEYERVLEAIERYSMRGNGEHNRIRLRAMVLLLRHSGLRIGDAVALTRDRVKDGKLFLYTHKTGAPVWLPLPKDVVDALNQLPGERYFWSGNGKVKSAVGDWQRSFRKLFKLAKVDGGHPHRFRDTFSTALLSAGVSVENVATLLGNTPAVVLKHYSPWVVERQNSLESAIRRTWIREVA